MDFGKIENIILVAVAAAVGLFFIVAFFAVVSKGKRKCKAVDVALRVFAALVIFVCAVLYVCAIFTELKGSTRIDATVDPAVLYIGGSATKLPLSALFVMLTQKTMQEIIILLFFAAVVVLAADCMLANKKDKKNKKKSPEQIKREKELEKIRRLGDSAVKKSGDAAEADPAPVEKKSEPVEQDDESFDWRVDTSAQKTTQKAEFVGISDNASDNADDFDSFDNTLDAESEESESSFEGEPDAQLDSKFDDKNGEVSQEQELDEGEEFYEEPEQADDEQSEAYADVSDEADGFDDVSEADNIDEADAAFTEDVDETPWYAQGGEPTVEDEETVKADDSAETDEPSFDEPTVGADKNGYDDAYGDEVQPDRDIYIPEIRTVKRAPGPSTDSKRGSSAKKPAAKKPIAKSGAKKPTAKKTGAAKSATPKKSAAKAPTAKKQAEPNRRTDSKKLPVTRRYVILDRTNAVNIFSNYLKDRDGEEKDKLKSSINTIIIK